VRPWPRPRAPAAPGPTRRRFLRALAGGSLAAALPQAIARARAIDSGRAAGSLQDVRHIVILTQENRSFDHLFGTLRGVRGFADPRAVRLPDGRSVFAQASTSGVLNPYRSQLPDPGLQYLPDLDHNWASSHAAWNGGRYDGWIASKGAATMQCFARADLPFHYALADAFTICDAYYSSMMGPTDPNRYYLWSGGVGGAQAQDGGPVIDNAEKGYAWPTLPEALTRSGVSWKVYQDRGTGLTAPGKWGWTQDPYIGNFGDNALLYFDRFRSAQPGEPLFEGARGGTAAQDGQSLFAELAADIAAGRLPQVSWLVAPEAYSEHPNWPVNYGAWYVAQVLDCLTARPQVWAQTVFLLCYDEAGGFFDHMVPPYPAACAQAGASTVEAGGECFAPDQGAAAQPLGLGTRVPMIVISPWSRGGWVCSEVFDHTSIIRFIERRFAADHPGLAGAIPISPWRKAICGDLLSAFDFTGTDTHVPPLPPTTAYQPPDRARHADSLEPAPAALAPPPQEPGSRPARALPYDLQAHGRVHADGTAMEIVFDNRGARGACFHVRAQIPGASGPWSYTVGAGAQLSGRWDPVADGGSYDLQVYGPDGFYRAYRGTLAVPEAAACSVELAYEPGAVLLHIANAAAHAVEFEIEDAYGPGPTRLRVAAGAQRVQRIGTAAGRGWYDLVVQAPKGGALRWQFAGRLPSPEPGCSDPALGRHGRAVA